MNGETTMQPSAPLISVIMPSLNVATYIQQCIESVCSQTLRNLEIICVDARSTDGTREKLQALAEKDGRIRIIDSDVRSYGHQMNLGMAAARGKYIGIVETDDYIDPDMYETLYSAAEAQSADVVKANYFTNQQGKDDYYGLLVGLPYGRVIHPKDHLSLLTRRAAIWSGIYNREFLLHNGIRFLETPGASYQDTSFILKVWIAAERVYLVKKAFLHYRLDNPNSSVNSKDKVFFVREELLAAHEYLNAQLEKKGSYEKILWDCEANIYDWNYKRLSDDIKLLFLAGVQSRYQEGLKNHCFDRRYIRWQVWKMIQQVAENPLLYLKSTVSKEAFERIASQTEIASPTPEQYSRWAKAEKRLFFPQSFVDVVNYMRNYGIAYSLQAIKDRVRE